MIKRLQWFKYNDPIGLFFIIVGTLGGTIELCGINVVIDIVATEFSFDFWGGLLAIISSLALPIAAVFCVHHFITKPNV